MKKKYMPGRAVDDTRHIIIPAVYYCTDDDYWDSLCRRKAAINAYIISVAKAKMPGFIITCASLVLALFCSAMAIEVLLQLGYQYAIFTAAAAIGVGTAVGAKINTVHIDRRRAVGHKMYQEYYNDRRAYRSNEYLYAILRHPDAISDISMHGGKLTIVYHIGNRLLADVFAYTVKGDADVDAPFVRIENNHLYGCGIDDTTK